MHLAHKFFLQMIYAKQSTVSTLNSQFLTIRDNNNTLVNLLLFINGANKLSIWTTKDFNNNTNHF
jgi:hypothetical protein